MRIIYAAACDAITKLNIGRQGENEACEVRFPVDSWLSEYPIAGTFGLLHKRKGDKLPYSVTISHDSTYVYWVVKDIDTAIDGEGECELTYSIDNRVVKSQIWKTITDRSLGADVNEVPDGWESWIDTVVESGNKAVDAVGKTSYINSEGNWMEWDASIGEFKDTGVHAQGPQGDKGDTGERSFSPYVNEYGTWVEWDNETRQFLDTGIHAQGPQGDPGRDGTDGSDGKDGRDGKDGKDGRDGYDGFSPLINVHQTGNKVFISATDKNGTTSVEFKTVVTREEAEEPVPGLKIVTWADGTWEEIADMLNAHYDGVIDILDYWAVGDTRKVHITDIPASANGKAQEEQDVEFVIIGMEHNDMAGNPMKTAVTIQQKNALVITDSMDTIADNAGGYASTARYNWLRSDYFSALPVPLTELIWPVNIVTDGAVTTERVFLLSDEEVTGNANAAPSAEGTVYDYYKVAANRIKSAGIDGTAPTSWWLRSKYKNNDYGYCSVNGSGSVVSSNATFGRGIAPAMCL